MPGGEIILSTPNGIRNTHFELQKIVENLFYDINYTEIDLDTILSKRRKNYRQFAIFLNHILIDYYSHPTIVERITKKDEAPFPGGNFVKEGDIYLLEDVYLRGKIYRDI